MREALLEAADLVMAGTHTEVQWDKGPATTYLQTWHGTPLKRIHRDVLWAPPGRLDSLDHDVAKWDLLLSPNAVTTPRLRKASGYDRAVLESAYPRNDVLSSPDLSRLGARVRAGLGIADDVTTALLLYAPTWRDDEVLTETTSDVPFALDLRAFASVRGPGQVLLARAHSMATGRSRLVEASGAYDVSYYPDVRDPYAAADVLVTDYSSVIFDFAITGRPILFYAYDLDRFQDSIRGFYFDLVPEAPGPVVRTQDELFDALGDLPAVTAQYADHYAKFRRTYTFWRMDTRRTGYCIGSVCSFRGVAALLAFERKGYLSRHDSMGSGTRLRSVRRSEPSRFLRQHGDLRRRRGRYPRTRSPSWVRASREVRPSGPARGRDRYAQVQSTAEQGVGHQPAS
jgi:CDP-glycerol glycerophosphotransferase